MFQSQLLPAEKRRFGQAVEVKASSAAAGPAQRLDDWVKTKIGHRNEQVAMFCPEAKAETVEVTLPDWAAEEVILKLEEAGKKVARQKFQHNGIDYITFQMPKSDLDKLTAPFSAVWEWNWSFVNGIYKQYEEAVKKSGIVLTYVKHPEHKESHYPKALNPLELTFPDNQTAEAFKKEVNDDSYTIKESYVSKIHVC
jgi:hypothetical protein